MCFVVFCGDHLFRACSLCSACCFCAVPIYRCLGEMCVVLFDEPYGSRMTHLPVCERQPLWEGRERIRDAYSLPSQRFSLALSFPQPTPLLWRTDELNRSHDFMKKISFLSVLCSIVGMCSFGCCLEGDGEGGKRGTGGENPEGEGGLQPGCPPSPGLSPQDIGKTLLRDLSMQTIRKRTTGNGHESQQGGRRVSTALLLPSNSRYPDPPHRSGADPPPAARPGWRWWWLR